MSAEVCEIRDCENEPWASGRCAEHTVCHRCGQPGVKDETTAGPICAGCIEEDGAAEEEERREEPMWDTQEEARGER